MFEEHADSTTTTVPRTKKAKLNTVDDAQAVVEWYGKYHKLKNEQLKDVLRWNRQVMTPPTKEALLYKAIDGALYGRLARCALCGGGRLKITFPDISKAKSTPPPGGALVVCSGSFDEDTQRRIDCAFSCAPSAAPRLQPWYGTVEPTESEQEEMDRIDLAAKNGGDGSNDKNDGSSSSVKAEKGDMEEDDVAKLQRAASALEWNLSSRDGMREAAAAIVKLFSQHSGPRTIDLPAAVINVEDDDNDTTSGENAAALQKIGPTIAANRTKSASELIPILVALFGFKEEKQAKADRKQAALTTIVACPDNAPLVAAFVELSDLYFKTGNANAGISYKKVVGALAALKMPVTTDNAKGLGGGKTKVPNIGKSSAEKILEFVTTGTMEKLEEKRIEAS